MRLCQRTVLLLKLGEQPHILDGDHRLVSEGSEQFRLLSGEGSGLRACSEDHADRLSIAQHRDREHAAVVGSPRHVAIREMWILKNIRNAHYRPAPDRPAGGASLVEWPREDFPEHLASCCLPGKGFRQLLITRLKLVEQPHVLDRDDRLVGEGLEELDMAV